MGCSSSSTKTVPQGNGVISVEPAIESENGRAKPRTGFHKDYVVGKRLGSGSYSTVRDAVHVRSKENVAVKIVTKTALTQEDLDALYVEVEVLRKLDHPNVVKLSAFYEDAERFYLVMENMKGGELLRQIERRRCFTEIDARKVVKVLLKAIMYCHALGIVHRDLKPENILLKEDKEDSEIKLADFGFAHTFVVGENELQTCLGTPGYVAPEIITKQRYGPAVDVWSLGVIFYILLCGYPPFLADTRAALFRCIMKGRFEFHDDAWGQVSDEAKDFISQMLVVDPQKRATPKQLLEHKWITAKKSLSPYNLTVSLANLKGFNARRRLKRAFHAVRAAEKLKRASVDYARSALVKIREEVDENGNYTQELEIVDREGGRDGVAVAARVGAYVKPDASEETASGAGGAGAGADESKDNA